MDTPIKTTSLVKTIKVVIWTGVMVFTLIAIDKIFFPEIKKGWLTAKDLNEIPKNIKFGEIPTYLPNLLSWPPSVILYRQQPSEGWWYGLSNKDGEIILWMGVGNTPHPNELNNFSICMDIVHGGQCPTGWHYFTKKMPNEKTIHLLSKIDPSEAKKILTALEVSAH